MMTDLEWCRAFIDHNCIYRSPQHDLMGISIDCDESTPIPHRTTLTLTCDGDHGGLFDPPAMCFDFGGYAENYKAAMRAGWTQREEKWLCPACSGKRS